MDWNDTELDQAHFSKPLRVEVEGSPRFRKITCRFVHTQLVMVEVFEYQKTGKRGRPSILSKYFYWYGENCPQLDLLHNLNRQLLAKAERKELQAAIPKERRHEQGIRRL